MVGDDCLSLNVCCPAGAPDAAGLPVPVWVHGGANKEGSSSECGLLRPGEAWAALGVVGVSLSYRTGLHGFLHLPKASSDTTTPTTNNALRDLVAGLEWVRAEIGRFGGDPANVCLFGESAVNIASLLASPKAQGLFHKAVLSSGGPKAFTAGSEYDAVLKAFRVALQEDEETKAKGWVGETEESQQRLAAALCGPPDDGSAGATTASSSAASAAGERLAAATQRVKDPFDGVSTGASTPHFNALVCGGRRAARAYS